MLKEALLSGRPRKTSKVLSSRLLIGKLQLRKLTSKSRRLKLPLSKLKKMKMKMQRKKLKTNSKRLKLS